jgi:hypothetical protein
MAGYSGTPLVKKLGIKENFRVAFVDAPENFVDQLEPLPTNIKIVERAQRSMDFVLFFTKSASTLEKKFLKLAQSLKPDGMLWISWPKKTSGVVTDLTENIVRDIGLHAGLVDVKVCAVDEVWSGLKFVYRLKDRKLGLRS